MAHSSTLGELVKSFRQYLRLTHWLLTQRINLDQRAQSYRHNEQKQHAKTLIQKHVRENLDT